jgi:hypothetical protein
MMMHGLANPTFTKKTLQQSQSPKLFFIFLRTPFQFEHVNTQPARALRFWQHHNLVFTCTNVTQRVRQQSSRSWFRASSFIKLSKTLRDAQLF